MTRAIAIAGIGRTEFSKRSGRTTLGMAAAACRDALADAGMVPADCDGISNFALHDSVAGRLSSGAAVAQAIGMDEVNFCLDVSGGGNVAVSVVLNAARAVAAGTCNAVLVFRSLNGRSGHRIGQYSGPLELEYEGQFNGPQGYIAPPLMFAMWARRHQHVYGSTSEDLGQIATTQRRHALPNPAAIARTPLTMDEYLAARFIAEPFRLYDCCQEIDGAVAIVVTSLERARAGPHRPVMILDGVESWGSGGSFDNWTDPTQMYGALLAKRLWTKTGLNPSDMDVACIYDCFTYTVLATVEDLGFCPKGEGGAFFAESRATYGGDVVVNPHGGLLSEGYIHGMNHHYEAVLQLRGEAGERQVPGSELAVITGGGGPMGAAAVYAIDR